MNIYNNKFTTSIYGYIYIFYFGVILYCKYNQLEVIILCIKILGEEDIVPHSMVSEKWINTNNVSDYNCGYSSNDTW